MEISIDSAPELDPLDLLEGPLGPEIRRRGGCLPKGDPGRDERVLLVLTSESRTSGQLRNALGTDADPSEAEVMVVAPAYAESALRFWRSDADETIAKADAVRRETVRELDKGGVPAAGDTGEAHPHTAIADALKTFDADRIVLYTRGGEDQRYREDVDRDELAARFGRPVDGAVV
jgi:hypothetical protein